MAGDGEQMRMLRRLEGASTACLSLASHDDILPRGLPPPPPSLLHLVPPPSIHLRSPPSPALQPPSSSQQEPELTALPVQTRRRKLTFCRVGFVSFFFPSPLTDDDSGLPDLSRFFSLSLLLRPSLLCLSLPHCHVGWLHIPPARCFSPQWSRPY